jgi:predicted ABC-type ATPase
LAERVLAGGYAIPEVDIRRRYEMGFNNFLQLYKPLADDWSMWNTSTTSPMLQDSSDHLQGTEVIEKSLKKAVAQALERHKRLGESIAVWQGGKVVVLGAKEIRTDGEK